MSTATENAPVSGEQAALNLPPWKRFWRGKLQPRFSTGALLSLADALASRSSFLVQGMATDYDRTQHAFGQSVDDCRVCGVCVITFCVIHDHPVKTFGEANEAFARFCQEVAPYGECSAFFSFWDDNPREQVFEELLLEVQCELQLRDLLGATQAPDVVPPFGL